MRPLFPGGMGRPIRPSMRKSGDRPAIVSTRPALEGGAAHAVFRSYGCTDLDLCFSGGQPGGGHSRLGCRSVRGRRAGSAGLRCQPARRSGANHGRSERRLRTQNPGGRRASYRRHRPRLCQPHRGAFRRRAHRTGHRTASGQRQGCRLRHGRRRQRHARQRFPHLGTGTAPAQRTAGDGPHALRARCGLEPDRWPGRRHWTLHPRGLSHLQPGADRRRARQYLRRQLRFRPHPRRVARPHRSGARPSIRGLRTLRQQRRH